MALGLKQVFTRALRSQRTLVAVGVFAAALIVLCANVLVHRFYKRWDVTSAQLYTLSPATVESLHGLTESVDFVVFLSREDPLRAAVQKLLLAYSAESRMLRVTYVDPDDNPAEFLALQRKYDLVEGKTEDGRLASDAAVVIARAGRRWFVTPDDVVAVEEDQAAVRPRLEQAFTEGLRQVAVGEPVSACFTTGHGELSTEQGGPHSLTELRYRLEKDNFKVQLIDLSSEVSTSSCRLVVVAGPSKPFSAAAAAHLVNYVRQGGNLGLFAPPSFDEQGQAINLQLSAVSGLIGVELGGGLVVEADPTRVVSVGWGGEVFQAEAREHPVTHGLAQSAGAGTVEVVMAQAVVPTPGSASTVLLRTSDQAGTVDALDLSNQGEGPLAARFKPSGAPLSLAVAAELPAGSGGARARVVIAGFVNSLLAQSWRDPRVMPNRVFTESALAWLTSTPPLVSVPEKAAAPAGLSLSQEEHAAVVRYVLVYLPAVALVLGGIVLVRRRQKLPVGRGKAA